MLRKSLKGSKHNLKMIWEIGCYAIEILIRYYSKKNVRFVTNFFVQLFLFRLFSFHARGKNDSTLKKSQLNPNMNLKCSETKIGMSIVQHIFHPFMLPICKIK